MPPRGNRVRAKNFCLTIYDVSEEMSTRLCGLVAAGKLRYIVFQLETCPRTGRAHYQTYLQTKGRSSYAQVQTIVGVPNCHVEQRAGSHEEAAKYCKKLESRFVGPSPEGCEVSGEYGEPITGPGMRSDIMALKESIDEGLSEKELFDLHFASMIRNYRAVDYYVRLSIPKRRHQTKALVLFGDTGNGKSYRANQAYPDAFHLRRPNDNNVWWDGYRGQETVIVEEFEGWLPIVMIKTMIDEHPMQVAVKNASVEFSPTLVIFLSNKDPRIWWPKACPGSLPAPIVRRLSDPIGAVYRVVARQLPGGDILCGTEPVDVSVPFPVIHVA